MRFPLLLVGWLVSVSIAGGCRSVEHAVVEAPRADTRLDWWREARFGMFIHWGLYAIPAGEWNGRTDYGEWIRANAQIPLERYEQFREQWNPVKFDADAWARAARDAGMKYVVVTTKHHDGFCLFDSKVTDWDVMSTPWKRDAMGELSRAFARQGLVTCWYHSIMDWHHPDYLPRRDFERDRGSEGADFERYEEYLHAQVTELLTRYGPIGVMWFDGEWEAMWNHERGQRLYDLCRQLQPNVIVNNRVDVGRRGMGGMTSSGEYCGDFGTPEQEVPETGLPGVDWEACVTMNGNWGYNAHDTDFKSTRTLLRTLVDVASKGGNFLLNVGPTAEGEFPPACLERLSEIGRWMRVNGNAIHGTQASPIEAPAWGRVTQREDRGDTRLYLHVFDWPASGRLVVKGLGNTVVQARMMSDAEHELAVEGGNGGFTVELPERASDPDVSVVEVLLRGLPIVYAPPRIEVAANVFVTPVDVKLVPPSAGVEVRYTLDGSEPVATSALARGRVSIAETTTIRARTFHGDRPVSGVVERTLTRLVLVRGADVAGLSPGLVCTRGRGPGQSVDAVWQTDAGMGPSIADRIAIPADVRGGTHVSLHFTGFVRARADDVYRFRLNSDDGSRLSIDGALVCNNDGLHTPLDVEGTVALAEGWHPIDVTWFNDSGGAALSLTMARIGDEMHAIAGADLAH